MLAMPNNQKRLIEHRKTSLEMKGPDLVCKESHGQCLPVPWAWRLCPSLQGWEVAVIAGGKYRVVTEITKVLKRHGEHGGGRERDHLRLGQPWVIQLAPSEQRQSTTQGKHPRQRRADKPGQCGRAGGLPAPGQTAQEAQGLFVSKQEEGTILAGSMPRQSRGFPFSRPHFPDAGVSVGFVLLPIKGSMCGFAL